MLSLYADFPAQFDPGTPLLVTIDALEVPLNCERFERRGPSGAVASFADFDTERRAQELVGLEFRIECDEDEDDEDDEEDADDANDDDIASEPFYEVACPNCGETVYVSEDDLDAGEANCAHCGVTFEVALEDDDEEQEEGPVQYEVTCPACGQTTVFEEDDLLDGAPKCPGCGKPLDFEVTEE